ncbi:MAG: hypothetical protein A2008_10510 [Candidatus Wallbacteria bacterium GWC2_49_35]|uniref:Two-component system response regulator n=1 Tax=Candidatus Wallbacteria bacterium GWC2_49_35 TaxID=1817813 RepID=A0A1F7WUA2_9BACT|nr:MAG: hypothetical protein A2008_10510 [Candidatus Wallbacteria bacterium GWC2_49_35]
MKYNILIIEDEKNQAELISKILTRKGFDTFVAASEKAALESLSVNRIDLILTDYKLPDATGLEIINKVRLINPEITIIVMTAFGDVDIAVSCLKGGAADFLTKPLDLDELDRVIFKLLKNKMLVEEVKQLRRDIEKSYSAENICGISGKLMSEIQKSVKAAETGASVLIRGESGTGKEIFANLIHYNSDRRDKAYIKVNCSAIPQDLIESELFGHLKGSFTGAYAEKTGKFEAADGGTLFLDEIGEMPVSMQAKLLRALQEREIEPVGAIKPKKINVRLIFATNVNLEDAVKNQKFREDLYYRINAVAINLPPLRERKEDIALLAKYFINKFNGSLKRSIKDISSDALDRLIKYPWPGNIRELQNIIENTMVLMNSADEIIYERNLPEKITSYKLSGSASADGRDDIRTAVVKMLDDIYDSGKTLNIGNFTDDIEKIMIGWAVEKMKGPGVKTKTADFFGINEKSVRNKIDKYGIIV